MSRFNLSINLQGVAPGAQPAAPFPPAFPTALARWSHDYPQFEFWSITKVRRVNFYDIGNPAGGSHEGVKSINREVSNLAEGETVLVGFYDVERRRPYIVARGTGVGAPEVTPEPSLNSWPTFRHTYARASYLPDTASLTNNWIIDSEYPTSIRFSLTGVRWDRIGSSGLFIINGPWELMRNSEEVTAGSSANIWHDLSLVGENVVALVSPYETEFWNDAPDYPLPPTDVDTVMKLTALGPNEFGVYGTLWTTDLPEIEEDDDGGGDDGGGGVGEV